MKKPIFTLISMFIFVIILAACNNGDENTTTTVSTSTTGQSDEVADDAVRITITLDDGQQFINEEEVEIEEGSNLLEVLEQTFYIETDEDNEITSIERQQIDEEENTSWVLIVNGEQTEVSAKDYTLNGGEKITFDLQ